MFTQKHRRSRGLGLIVTILVALNLGACGPTPTTMTEKFYMAVSEGKLEEASDMIDMEPLKAIGIKREHLKPGLIRKSDEFNRSDCGGLKEVATVSEEIRGEIATRKTRLVCKSGKTIMVNDKLSKGRDGWKHVVES